jgi:hypothetical protein
VTKLGRVMVSGNTGTHTVKIVRKSDYVQMVSTSVTPSGTAGTFTLVPCACTVLAASTSYFCLSTELNAGDQWYDSTAVSGDSGITIDGSVYWDGASLYVLAASGVLSYVPPTFVFGTACSPARLLLMGIGALLDSNRVTSRRGMLKPLLQ